MKVELREFGDAIAMILPEEALAHMQAKVGDILLFTKTPNGYQIALSQSEFAQTMTVMEDLAKRYSSTLDKLSE